MSDDEKAYEVTDEDKVAAARTILVNTPLKEFQEVHKEVKTLLGKKALLDEAMKSIPGHWETFHAAIDTGKDAKQPYVLLSSAGKVGELEYACPISQTAYTVDLEKQVATDSRDLTSDEQKELGIEDELRVTLEKNMATYVQDHHEGCGKYAVYKKGDDYIICVHADLENKGNFWTGTLTNTATLSGGTDLKFDTKVQIHYWEDGNCQLNSSWDGTAKVKPGKALAVDVVKELTKHVNEYHNIVSKDFASMNSATLKLMRRILPFTKQKIQWSKLEGYKLSKGDS